MFAGTSLGLDRISSSSYSASKFSARQLLANNIHYQKYLVVKYWTAVLAGSSATATSMLMVTFSASHVKKTYPCF